LKFILLLLFFLFTFQTNAKISLKEQRKIVENLSKIYVKKNSINIKITYTDKYPGSWARFLNHTNAEILVSTKEIEADFVTIESQSALLCHEFGHIMGGAPLNPMGNEKGHVTTLMITTEGQAHYFAFQECLKKLWKNENNINIVKKLENEGKVTSLFKHKCQLVYKEPNQLAICIRSMVAAHIYMSPVPKLKPLTIQGHQFNMNQWSINNYDKTKIPYHLHDAYPAPQCFLDTAFSGSLCNININDFKKRSRTNPTAGNCSSINGNKEGARPSCWYRTPTKDKQTAKYILTHQDFLNLENGSNLQLQLYVYNKRKIKNIYFKPDILSLGELSKLKFKIISPSGYESDLLSIPNNHIKFSQKGKYKQTANNYIFKKENSPSFKGFSNLFSFGKWKVSFKLPKNWIKGRLRGGYLLIKFQ